MSSKIWNIIGLGIIAAVLFAPIYYVYLILKKSPRLTRKTNNYKLSESEEKTLSAARSKLSKLEVQHNNNLEKGLKITKSGQFDKRSSEGREAAEVKHALDEQFSMAKHLSKLPLERLSNAVSARKVKISALFALTGLSIALMEFKKYTENLGDEGLIGMYFASTVISIGVFIGAWIILSIWYWVTYSPVKKRLLEDS